MSAPTVAAGSEERTGDRAPAADQRGFPWLPVLVAVSIILAIAVSILRGSYRDGPLEPDAPTPQGARAVVTVLEERGTEVTVRRHTEDAAQALRDGGTVAVTAPKGLNGAQLDALSTALDDAPDSARLVLVAPDMITLGYLGTGISVAGSQRTEAVLDAGGECRDAAFAARQVQVQGRDSRFGAATLYHGGQEGVCFASDPEQGLVAVDGSLVVLGSADLLANETIANADNSAVALNALGHADSLTWYVPSATDPMASASSTLLTHLPRWVFPVAAWAVLLAGLAVLAASRRLGPVVVEPLPVTVRAQELVLGRARLMHRAGTRDAAAASLRAATAARLADRVGVRRNGTLRELVAALAEHVTADEAALMRLLGPAPIASDQELVRLSHDLDRLEKEIER